MGYRVDMIAAGKVVVAAFPTSLYARDGRCDGALCEMEVVAAREGVGSTFSSRCPNNGLKQWANDRQLRPVEVL